jgi:hypothetical protein
MREQPDIVELIDAVTHFLRQDAAPKLTGITGFHARVAANALDIVRREIVSGPAATASEAARLQALLGHDGDCEALNAELCERIAGGTVDPEDPALLDHLWRTTLDTLAIDQPKYATFRRVAEAAARTSSDI